MVGDAVDDLTELLRNRINLHEGNVTPEEYEQQEEYLACRWAPKER